ncbi:hypothetical protein TWF225_009459 [Orbilia oligospora]|uniref:NEDD8-activating enzyme E1 regulatory subunit n=1 Tax=Orbilia oligospora TaxID=2813651 RepID=A0A7C8PQ19_ORBOL|nr:hypothetical protein TWF751_007508 [Orbilia oligospora]KAF3174737.1 hypothetical protein TWF225_009459 [Orbilia oligospora]KAF3259443.1 hypothetical protein TWF217_005141 [Orbilia oligospora]KAF3263925.1 hypothetical protein TWF128_001561 [Orbilia oligospora]KAF3290169.1 hypothetical protein TWF132_007168 [Orbilia oligospora]
MSVPGAPTAKEKKYDRQLRLWGAGGQEALETAHILLINATAAGSETLKNLVLPGVGQFTILDQAVVTDEDLGTNFFLDDSSIGLPRAQKACELLCELNPEVQGHFIKDTIENILKSSPEKLKDFTTVIATGDVSTDTLLSLDAILYPLGIPIFVVKCVGFTMSCRLALAEHPIVETHPASTVDLRLFNPFPELSALVDEKTAFINDQEKMTIHEHGHLPYVLILLQTLNEWKSVHDNQPPSNYSQKNEFKSLLRSKMWNADEENFEEAIAAVLPHFNPPSIPSETRAIFQDEKCTSLTKESTQFWVIARAIKEFSERNDGLLPLPGALPDMKAESKDYIRLQNIYKSKARADLAAVVGIVQDLLKGLGRDGGEIAESEVETFCKHAGYAKLIRGRSLNEEYEKSPKAQVISNELSDPTSLIHYYLGLRAYEAFISEQSSAQRIAPGAEDSTVDADTEKLKKHVTELLDKLSITYSSELLEGTEKAIGEIVRAGGGELHNIASLTGGVVAQEVIKVITKQYIPMNNTVLFDGISSRTTVYQL